MLGRAKVILAGALLMGVCAVSDPAMNSGLAVYVGQANNTNDTFTSVSCFPGNTVFLNPSANAADTGGDNNGFESSPQNAYTDGSGYATNENGPGDRHRFYNYSTSIKSSCAIKGIEVRLDWWVSTTFDTNGMSVELSWDGGMSWTSAKTDSQESSSEHVAVLGGPADTWGHSWTVSELSNANFRVRLTCNCSGTWCYLRDFYLDWVAVSVYYTPP